MSEPHKITSRPTHVNGVAIVALEPAVGPHPRHRDRIVPRRGVSRALLEDESEVYICDGDGLTICHFTGADVWSVASHRNGTHNRTVPHRSLYTDEVIRLIATEVERAKRAGTRGFCERTAKALNEAGVKTVSGTPWTAGAVSNIWNSWGKQVRVRLTQPKAAPGAKAARAAANGAAGDDDLAVLRGFAALLPQVAGALERILDKVARGEAVSADVLEKARLYEQIQGLTARK